MVSYIYYPQIKSVFVKPPITASLTIEPKSLSAIKNPPAQINIENIEKANISIDITNNTKEDIRDLKVTILALNKTNSYKHLRLGSTTTPYSMLDHKIGGPNLVTIDILTPLKAGEKINLKGFVFTVKEDSLTIQSGVISNKYKVSTNKANVTFK